MLAVTRVGDNLHLRVVVRRFVCIYSIVLKVAVFKGGDFRSIVLGTAGQKKKL